MILICYDGSPDAQAAIRQTAELLRDHPATVLTVWQPFVEVLTHTPSGFGLAPGMADIDAIDEATRHNAQRLAEEGAALARDAGLNAQPRTCSQQTTTAEAILSEAQTIGASAVVMGSRGLTGVKSFVLGSVSHAVLHHADLTVVVVPSPGVAAERASRRRAAHASP